MSWWRRWRRRRAVRLIFGSVADVPGQELLILGLTFSTELLDDGDPAIAALAGDQAYRAAFVAVEKRARGDAEFVG